MGTRINKFLSEQGYCSRREADRLILAGQVLINGRKAQTGESVEPGDLVKVDGRILKQTRRRHVYLALNKPVGIITTTDLNKPNNVIDFVGQETRIFPIGRLDVASSGLLLLTDDGEMANRLTHPRYGHEKEYQVKLAQPISDNDLKTLAQGVRLDDGMTRKAWVQRLGQRTFQISIREGRNRQIRRMCEAIGHEVVSLVRIRVANINLGTLQEGQVRKLTSGELADLRRTCGLT
jgi:pseudouridine synthase